MTNTTNFEPGSIVEVTDPDSPLRGQTCTVIEVRDEPAPQHIRDAHPGVVSVVHRKVRSLLGHEAWVLGVTSPP